MLRRVAAFCRPLRPVLLLVSFPRSRSPVVGVLGLCWLWRDVAFACQTQGLQVTTDPERVRGGGGGHGPAAAAPAAPASARPPPPPPFAALRIGSVPGIRQDTSAGPCPPRAGVGGFGALPVRLRAPARRPGPDGCGSGSPVARGCGVQTGATRGSAPCLPECHGSSAGGRAGGGGGGGAHRAHCMAHCHRGRVLYTARAASPRRSAHPQALRLGVGGAGPRRWRATMPNKAPHPSPGGSRGRGGRSGPRDVRGGATRGAPAVPRGRRGPGGWRGDDRSAGTPDGLGGGGDWLGEGAGRDADHGTRRTAGRRGRGTRTERGQNMSSGFGKEPPPPPGKST